MKKSRLSSAPLLKVMALGVMATLLTACNTVGVHGHTAMAADHGQSVKQKTTGDSSADTQSTKVLDMSRHTTLDGISEQLQGKRVIYVGETHDNYAHHLNQLEVIRRIHGAHPDMAIGMEMFQRPFQRVLDDFISGKTDELTLIRNSEWFGRWRYDYRLYQPILNFAREQGIPVVALNASAEIKARVSEVGFDGLTAEEQAQVPAEVDRSDLSYIERLRSVFHQHPGSSKRDFDRFLDVQLLWDETMAETVALYLQEHVGKKMVVLAGSGHLMNGSGIPQRVERRAALDGAIVLPGDNLDIKPGIADFILFPEMQSLPKAGLMGIYMEDAEGGVKVAELASKSASGSAGVAKGDLIVELNGKPVKSSVDIKIGLMGLSPGTPVVLEVKRKGVIWGEKLLSFSFELGE